MTAYKPLIIIYNSDYIGGIHLVLGLSLSDSIQLGHKSIRFITYSLRIRLKIITQSAIWMIIEQNNNEQGT